MENIGKNVPLEGRVHKDSESIENLEEQVQLLVEVDGSLRDYRRKISYPAALVLALIPQFAEAAEIPENASFEKGIELLREGAETDLVETSAIYVQLPDGTGAWQSKEQGETTSYFDLEDIKRFIKNSLEGKEFEKGTEVVVRLIHNHPLHSGKTKRPDLMPESAETASLPPSIGFAANVDAGLDTSHTTEEFIEAHLTQLEKELGIDVVKEQLVVDMQGVWKYSRSSTEEWQSVSSLVADAWQNFTEKKDEIVRYIHAHQTKTNFDSDLKYQELKRVLTEAYKGAYQYNRLGTEESAAWIQASQTTPAAELVKTDLYEQLKLGYAVTGVTVTFEPFDESK